MCCIVMYNVCPCASYIVVCVRVYSIYQGLSHSCDLDYTVRFLISTAHYILTATTHIGATLVVAPLDLLLFPLVSFRMIDFPAESIA